MTTALSTKTENYGVIDPETLKNMLAQALHIFQSGLMPEKFHNEKQMLVAAMHGRELGLTFMQSLAEVHVIKGVPAASAKLQLGKARAFAESRGGYINILDQTKDRCVIEAKRGKDATPRKYTYEMAEVPSVLRKKDNWMNHPVDMLMARCITRMNRGEFSDVLMGFGYSPEELQDAATLRESTGAMGTQTESPIPKRGAPKAAEATVIDEEIKAFTPPSPAADPLASAFPTEPGPEASALHKDICEAEANAPAVDICDENAIMELVADLGVAEDENSMGRIYDTFRQGQHNETTLLEAYRTFFKAKGARRAPETQN